jgi:WhiB family redox-sensing transcriptional regulator
VKAKSEIERLAQTFIDGEWFDDAACAGMDTTIFFPERGQTSRKAKQVCYSCPVREDCLEEALARREMFGIWGGMSEKERATERRLRRELARKQAS